MVAKLAVFDIDDTLLASNKTFLKSTLTSIKKLKQQQINVAIATGRNLAMADNADKTYILTDSSKFELTSTVHQLPFQQVDTVITDNQLSKEAHRVLNFQQIKVQTVATH